MDGDSESDILRLFGRSRHPAILVEPRHGGWDDFIRTANKNFLLKVVDSPGLDIDLVMGGVPADVRERIMIKLFEQTASKHVADQCIHQIPTPVDNLQPVVLAAVAGTYSGMLELRNRYKNKKYLGM